MVTKLRIKFGNVKAFEMSSNDEDAAIRACSKKRGASELEEVQAKKKLKLDGRSSSQCLALLRLLGDHRFGAVFREPVDPVKLKIPDYFEIISKPMDLGTIKSKLLRNVYSSADEFASDVRLTFGNAMLYNPRDNMVHQMAKDLKDVFEDRWDSLTKKKVSNDSNTQPVEVVCSRQSSPVKLKKPVLNRQSQNDISVDTSLATKLRIKKKVHVDCSSPSLKLKKPVVSPLLKPLATKKLEQSTSSLKLKKPVVKRQSLGVKILKSCNSSTTPSAHANETEKSGSQIATEVKAMPPLPPDKALRAALTIFKAKHHRKVLDKADLMRLRIEKERTQREEKARIEAELRQQQARERQYRDNLEKTSGLEEYCFEAFNKDLLYLCGTTNLTRKPLIDLGLFLRNDYCPQMELELSGAAAIQVDDVEEGEIV